MLEPCFLYANFILGLEGDVEWQKLVGREVLGAEVRVSGKVVVLSDEAPDVRLYVR